MTDTKGRDMHSNTIQHLEWAPALAALAALVVVGLGVGPAPASADVHSPHYHNACLGTLTCQRLTVGLGRNEIEPAKLIAPDPLHRHQGT